MARRFHVGFGLVLVLGTAGCGRAHDGSERATQSEESRAADARQRARALEENAARLEAEVARLSGQLPDMTDPPNGSTPRKFTVVRPIAHPGPTPARKLAEAAPIVPVTSPPTKGAGPEKPRKANAPSSAAVTVRRGTVTAEKSVRAKSQRALSAGALQRAIAPGGILIDNGGVPKLDYGDAR